MRRLTNAADHIQGELQRTGDIVSGWCWSRTRPRERLYVALMIDGRRVSSTVAARLRLDIVRDGICDGYHGFSLPLPVSVGSSSMIEVVELGSGQVFGRILPHDMADTQAWEAQVSTLGRKLIELHVAVPPVTAAPALRNALIEAGEIFRSRTIGYPVFRFPASFELRPHPAPRLSFVLDASDQPMAVMSAIVRLAPLLESNHAEIVVVSDGRNPASAALAALHGLRYIINTAPQRADRMEAAAISACGTMLVFLDAKKLRAELLYTVINHIMTESFVVVGEEILNEIHRADLDFELTRLENVDGQSGLIMTVPRCMYLNAPMDEIISKSRTYLRELNILSYVIKVEKVFFDGAHVVGRHH